MATSTLQDTFTCSVCLKIYKEPVTLPCDHNFCMRCIKRTWKTQMDEGIVSFCPICRWTYNELPKLKEDQDLCNILRKFRRADLKYYNTGIFCTYCDSHQTAALSCLRCEVSLCDNHVKTHYKSAEHVLTLSTVLFEDRKCSIHKELLRYQCTDDGARVCVSCCLAGEHRGHNMEFLNEAPEKIYIQAISALYVGAELTCSMCRKFFTNPAALPCDHFFCQDCLTQTLDWREKMWVWDPCPECGEYVGPYLTDVSDCTLLNILQSASNAGEDSANILYTYCASPESATKSCLDCEAHLCDKHVRMHSKSAKHILMDSSLFLNDEACSAHQMPLDYYCLEDEACICMRCMPNHTGHRVGAFWHIKEKLRIIQGMCNPDVRDKLTSICTEEFEISPEFPELNSSQEKLSNILEKMTLTQPDRCGPIAFCTTCIQLSEPLLERAIHSCLQCELSLCSSHGSEHMESTEHVLIERTMKCPTHQELLIYHCTEDGTRVCLSCCLAGEHRDHKVELLNETVDIRKTQVTACASLRNVLTCALCGRLYKDATPLPCGHNFCLVCISSKWQEQEEEGEDSSCPNCKEGCIRQPKTPRNQALNNTVQIYNKQPDQNLLSCTGCLDPDVDIAKSCLYCEASLCEDHVLKHSKSAEHVLSEPSASFVHRYCPKHWELLRYQCTEDGASVCVSCCLAGEHRGHKRHLLVSFPPV